MEFYQQGDVLIKRVKAIPASAKAFQTEEDQPTLARGELTGHAHRAVGSVAMFRKPTGAVYMHAQDRLTIIHEEHRPLEVPPGIYRVEKVRVYDHIRLFARAMGD